MLGDMLNNNKRKDVRTRIDQVQFNGKKYTMDPRSGYYTCTTGKGRKRLHVAVWETHWGRRVPPGCVIHHMDWNKKNNSIENLICLTVQEHNLVHNYKFNECGDDLEAETAWERETPDSERVIKLTKELLASRVDGLPADVVK